MEKELNIWVRVNKTNGFDLINQNISSTTSWKKITNKWVIICQKEKWDVGPRIK